MARKNYGQSEFYLHLNANMLMCTRDRQRVDCLTKYDGICCNERNLCITYAARCRSSDCAAAAGGGSSSKL